MKPLQTQVKRSESARVPPAAQAESDPARWHRHEAWILGASVILVAFNMRIAMTSISPLLPEIQSSIGLSPLAASLLTALPALCFGLISPLAPRLARSCGTERAIASALALLTVGTALRLAPYVPTLFSSQILSSCGIGILNVLLPSVVKRDFACRVSLLTALYTTSMAVGAALAAGAAVPLRDQLGQSWTWSLGFWAIPALLAWGVWIRQARPSGDRVQARHAVRGLWRDGLAWQVTLFMGLQSSIAYVIFGWFAPMLIDRGLEPAEAGIVFSVAVMIGAVGSLIGPALATYGQDQRLSILGVMALCMAGVLGSFLGPLSWIWVWAILVEVALGAVFAIALTLIVLRSPDAAVAAQLSGMAQSVGYLIASCGPLFAGLIRNWTGNWNAVAYFMAGVALLTACLGLGAGRNLQVRVASAEPRV